MNKKLLQIPNVPLYISIYDIINMLKEQFMKEIYRVAAFDKIHANSKNHEMWYYETDHYGNLLDPIPIDASERAFVLWDAIQNLNKYTQFD